MSMRNFLVAAALLGASAAAPAAITIFSDNFDADRTTNNATEFVHGWTVSDGTVDVDGTGFVHNEMPGNGHYVDLDGSTRRAGVLSNSFTAGAGGLYTLSFDLAGNQRHWGSDTVEVTFGGTRQSFVIGQSDPITTRTLTFTPATAGVYHFSFHNLGGDNRGAFLHRVSVSAVPETDTYAMMLTGLVCVGLMAGRRQRRDPPF